MPISFCWFLLESMQCDSNFHPKHSSRRSEPSRGQAPHLDCENVEFELIHPDEQSLLIAYGAGREFHDHLPSTYVARDATAMALAPDFALSLLDEFVSRQTGSTRDGGVERVIGHSSDFSRQVATAVVHHHHSFRHGTCQGQERQGQQ